MFGQLHIKIVIDISFNYNLNKDLLIMKLLEFQVEITS